MIKLSVSDIDRIIKEYKKQIRSAKGSHVHEVVLLAKAEIDQLKKSYIVTAWVNNRIEGFMLWLFEHDTHNSGYTLSSYIADCNSFLAELKDKAGSTSEEKFKRMVNRRRKWLREYLLQLNKSSVEEAKIEYECFNIRTAYLLRKKSSSG